MAAEQSEPFSDKRKVKKEKKKQKEKEKAREKIEAAVQILPWTSEKSLPLIGYFPSGFEPDEATSTQVKVYRNQSQSKANRLQLVVSPYGSGVDFVGASYSGEAAAPQMCTYTLGVLDKATQTLKIVPVAANKIFRLEPKVRGIAESEPEPTELAKEQLTEEEKKEKLRELTVAYGTKRSINQAKKLHALDRTDDPNAQKNLDMKINELEINKEALEGTSSHMARNIPPHDVSATTPEGAYPLEKIIVKGEWGFLEDIYQVLQDGADISNDSYPNFVCNRVFKLQVIEDEGKKKRLSGIFSYITHLIKFKDQHSVDRYSSSKGHRIPSILHQKFTSMFGNAESRRLSPEKIDLLVSYVLVLTLFADEFKSDPSDIAKDLKLNPVTLRAHYEQLGCKLSRQNGVLYATLPAPLQFPAMRRKRRRG